jgi:hypothetical protein
MTGLQPAGPPWAGRFGVGQTRLSGSNRCACHSARPKQDGNRKSPVPADRVGHNGAVASMGLHLMSSKESYDHVPPCDEP